MILREPWSKRHKIVTNKTVFSLSNSFAQPLDCKELLAMTRARGDDDLIDEFQNHSLAYTPSGGSLDLREEIAALYGQNINAENIVVFTGAQVALQTAAFAIIEENNHAIVFSPAYQSVQQAPLFAGADITVIALSAENNWQIDVSEVERAIKPNTKYMVINEPYNPAGTLMSISTQQQLKDLAQHHGIYLMFDEVYRLLEHKSGDRLPAMAELYNKGLSASTFSKPWGAGGIAIGWVALQDMSLKQRLVDAQYFGTVCPSRAGEIQAIMVLRSSEKILDRNLAIIQHNLKLIDAFIENYSDLFEWVRPNAGAIGFIKFKGPLNSNELGVELAKASISIKPAYVFADNSDAFSDYFRIGYGEKIMPAALAALEAYVSEHCDTWRQMR